MHHTPIKSIGYVTDVIEISCLKNKLPSMTSKCSHHLIKLLKLIGASIRQRHSLQRYHRLTMLLILWLISGWLVGFAALRPKSTAMVIAGRSVHLTTLFPGQA